MARINMWWKLPTVVRNGALAHPDTSGAPHTSYNKQSRTATRKRAVYRTVSRPHRCDMLCSTAKQSGVASHSEHHRHYFFLSLFASYRSLQMIMDSEESVIPKE
jgi:hypothetical protein